MTVANDASFWFIPLGIGDAFSQLHYSSCLYLWCDGFSLLVDCPHPIRKIMREASLTSGLDIRVETLGAIILTHLHADHSSGLEGLGFYAHYLAGLHPTLLAHEQVMTHVWDQHLAGTMAPLCDSPSQQRKLTDFYQPLIMTEHQAAQLGPFRIQCRLTHHHVPTTALKITADGATLGYSADTSFDPELIDWLQDSDLIIHETNDPPHTPYKRLAALDPELRLRMRLIHCPDHFDVASSVILPLEQGRRYPVPRSAE